MAGRTAAAPRGGIMLPNGFSDWTGSSPSNSLTGRSTGNQRPSKPKGGMAVSVQIASSRKTFANRARGPFTTQKYHAPRVSLLFAPFPGHRQPPLVIPAQAGTQTSIEMKGRNAFTSCCTFFRTRPVLRMKRRVPACAGIRFFGGQLL